MFASPWRAPRAAATRNRRPKTNWTIVAGMRNQRLMSVDRPRRAARPEHDRHHHAADDERRDRLEEQLATLRRALELGGIDVSGRIARGLATDVVAGRLDRRDDPGSVDDRGIEAHGGPLRREVDGRVADALGAREVALDAVDAAGAGHPDDRNAELGGRDGGGGRAHRCSKDTTGEYPAHHAAKGERWPARRAGHRFREQSVASVAGSGVRACPMPPFPHRESASGHAPCYPGTDRV